MYLKLTKGELNKLVQKAIKISGSERNLSKVTGLSKGTIYGLKFEKQLISEKHFHLLCNYVKIPISDHLVTKSFPDNWRQIKGGRQLIEKKKKDGTFKETIEKLKKSSSRRMKEWHSFMKKNHPEKYYRWQYDRFKKINKGYTFELTNGVKVRNELEKKIGDFLVRNYIEIKYEPYVLVKKKAYFPDFIIKNIVVEVTEWKHPSATKISYLNKKIKDLSDAGYNVIFFIPKRYSKFYKGLVSPVVSALPRLKDQINALVA